MKKLLLALLILVVIVVAVPVILLVTMDKTQLKQQISARLEQATGYHLTIAGDIDLSLYPSFGFTAHDVKLAGKTQDSVAFTGQKLVFGVKLKPLLQRQIDVSTVQIYDAEFRPYLLPDRRENMPKPDESKPDGSQPFMLSVAEILAEDVTVYPSAKQQLNIHSMTLKNVAQNQVFPLSLQGTWLDGTNKVALDIGSDLLWLTDSEQLQARKTTLALVIHGYDVPANLSDIHITTDADIILPQESVQLNNLHVKTSAGAVNGTARVKKWSNPRIALDLHAPSLQLATLQKTLGKPVYINGVMDVQTKLTTQGTSGDTIIKNLNGSAKLAMKEGVLEKWKLSQILNQAVMLSKEEKFDVAILTRLPDPSRENFKFTQLNTTATINNGIVHNNDLLVLAPGVHVTGAGVVNLPGEQVDYTLLLGRGDTTDRVRDAKKIPVTIKGRLNDPKIALDTERLIRERAGKRIDEEKEKLKGKLGEKLDQKLGTGIGKGLLDKLPF